MKQHIFINAFCIFLIIPFLGVAQKKSDYLDAAFKAEADKDYGEAARNFEKVWQFKKKKTKYINKAGEYYYVVKDYSKAEAAFENVIDDKKSYPLARYHYAKSLKANGKYDQAIAEFNSFLNNAKSSEKEEYASIVGQEIEGCEIGLNMKEGDYTIRSLDEINTKKFDFAPIPVSNASVLYYSSAYNKNVKIFRSTKEGGTWAKGKPLSALKGLKDKQVCNGSFDESLNTFYFTICDLADDTWGKLTSRCEINVITKTDKGSWGTPKSVASVNVNNATTSQPNFVSLGGTDYLFFASNREGGKGGMDIWYATKQEGSRVDGFSTPRNISFINTSEDDLTPFYSKTNEALYFSSKGRATIGGLDIFKASGLPNSFYDIEHLETPINSSTDDFYFYLNPDGSSGMLVSNRALSDGQRTTDEDIFEFVGGKSVSNLMVSGTLRDAEGKGLSKTALELYQLDDKGKETFLTKTFSDDEGNYEFVVLEDRNYLIRATGENDLGAQKEFETKGSSNLQFDMMMNDGKNQALASSSSTTQRKVEQAVTSSNLVDKAKDKVRSTTTNVRTAVNNTTNTSRVARDTKVEQTVGKVKDKVVNSFAETGTVSTTTTETGKKRKVITNDFYAENEPIQQQYTTTSSTTRTGTYTPSQNRSTTSTTYNSSANTNYGGTTSTNYNSTSSYSTGGTTTYNSSSSATYPTESYSSSSYSSSSNNSFYEEVERKRPDYSVSKAGVTYKIQVHAVKNYEEDRPRYEKVRRLGRSFETDLRGSHTRVILADSFDTMDEALENLDLMNEVGFKKARIVKYRNDKRIGFMPRY